MKNPEKLRNNKKNNTGASELEYDSPPFNGSALRNIINHINQTK